MASYLAFFAAGDGSRSQSRHHRRACPGRRRSPRSAMPHEQRASMRMLRRSPRIVRALEQDLGPYPFSSTGGLVTSLDVGFALENQTRPTYPVLGTAATPGCSCTSWPTSGSATRSPSPGGATSGSTKGAASFME